jgi:hypothetical protein
MAGPKRTAFGAHANAFLCAALWRGGAGAQRFKPGPCGRYTGLHLTFKARIALLIGIAMGGMVLLA